MTIEHRNAKFSTASLSHIDTELLHESLGWVPITITEQTYPDLWAQAIAGEVQPYVGESSEAHRESWRKSASISRTVFCTYLHKIGILFKDEAIEAAKGSWPASFLPLLDGLPEDQSAELQITWAAVQQIDRTNQFFEMVREYHNMTPEQADTMFGYVAPLD